MTDSSLASRPKRSYVRPPTPIHFPESEEVPDALRDPRRGKTGVHLELRTALYFLVRDFVGERGAVGSEQFVYWDPSDPRQCLAPDLIVRMGATPGLFPTWKTWERGAPHLAIEVASVFDAGEAEWQRKLARYRKCGINEIARFDPEDAKHPLRLWDRLEGDLVERDLTGEHALLCDTLGVHWCVQADATLGRVLRLSFDALGQTLVPTVDEQRAAAAERELAAERERAAEAERELAAERERAAEAERELAAERERAAEAERELAAERERAAERIAELEAELRRR
jgi:Uma2 family endonuclease